MNRVDARVVEGVACGVGAELVEVAFDQFSTRRDSGQFRSAHSAASPDHSAARARPARPGDRNDRGEAGSPCHEAV